MHQTHPLTETHGETAGGGGGGGGGSLPHAHPCVSLAGSAGGSAVPAAAGHGAQLPQQQRGQAASGAGEPRVSLSPPPWDSTIPVTSMAGKLQKFVGSLFLCVGMGGRCVSPLCGTEFPRVGASQD